jgi:hypothetical protein
MQISDALLKLEVPGAGYLPDIRTSIPLYLAVFMA